MFDNTDKRLFTAFRVMQDKKVSDESLENQILKIKEKLPACARIRRECVTKMKKIEKRAGTEAIPHDLAETWYRNEFKFWVLKEKLRRLEEILTARQSEREGKGFVLSASI